MKTNIHNNINLRAAMIDSLMIDAKKSYGRDSATFKSPLLKINIGLHVSYLLKTI